MATSDQPPSPALLRLRPADIVRLCGLNAAAAGLELVARHGVVAGRRDGSRLLATVHDVASRDVWVEILDEAGTAHWACDCAQMGPLACAHVAAILSAWIAHPTDFAASGAGAESLNDAESGGAPTPTPPPATASLAPPTQLSLDTRLVPAADSASLAAALARMNNADVDVIAHRILGPIPGAEFRDHDEDARQKLVATLSDPARLQALLHRLDGSARYLLTLLQLVGGTMTAADLEALAIRIAQPLSAVQSDVAVLERHVLLLPMLPTSAPSQHGPGSSWRHVAGWRIPDEARQALYPSLPLDALPTQHGNPSGPPLAETAGDPLHVIRNAPRTLCLAMALVASAPPPLGLPTAIPSSSESAGFARRGAGLLAPGELAPERLMDLARNAGLDIAATRMARRLLRLAREQHPSLPIAEMARAPVAERPVVLRAAFRRWLRTESAADLLDIESPGDHVKARYATAHPAFRPETIAREVTDGRRFIVRMLSHAQPETWYSLESFVSLAWQAHPGLLRGKQQAWATPAWWLESNQEQRVLQPQAREDWMAAEGAFIRSLVRGAFSVWGMVDLAMREDGAALAFRVTPFGAFLLQRDNSPADATLVALCDADWGPPVLPLRDGSLAVQPLAAGTSLLDALDLWATPTAVSGRRLVYILSPDRSCAAFDRHLSPASLPGLLRPLHSRAAESVAHQLNQWHAEWGHTRITTGFTLLEASDEATLVEALAAAPEIAARCRRIGPALAWALPEDAASLRALLARRGYAV